MEYCLRTFLLFFYDSYLWISWTYLYTICILWYLLFGISYSQQKLQREKYFDEKIFSEALWRFDWGFSKRLINLGTNQPGSPNPESKNEVQPYDDLILRKDRICQSVVTWLKFSWNLNSKWLHSISFQRFFDLSVYHFCAFDFRSPGLN